MTSTLTFQCGHPRTAENTRRGKNPACKFCLRVKAKIDRWAYKQDNSSKLTRGERIAQGFS